MRAVKYFIRDYEQSTGQRLVGFRRHVNSFIAGGGNAPSAQKPYTPQEAQAAQDIINGLKHYAKTFDPNDEEQNTELQKLKSLLLLPQDKALPMQVVGRYGIQHTFNSWEDVKNFILKHKDFCLNEERKSAFANVLTDTTCSPAAMDLIRNIVTAIDHLSPSPHRQQPLHTVESAESDDEMSFRASPLSEGHSTHLSYSDDDNSMEEQPSSTNNPTQNNVANKILGDILNNVHTQVERKQQLQDFVKKIHVIMNFYNRFALLTIRQQQQQNRQQIEQAKKQLIDRFQKWVSEIIHKTITPDMALSILARLVQMARKKKE